MRLCYNMGTHNNTDYCNLTIKRMIKNTTKLHVISQSINSSYLYPLSSQYATKTWCYAFSDFNQPNISKPVFANLISLVLKNHWHSTLVRNKYITFSFSFNFWKQNRFCRVMSPTWYFCYLRERSNFPRDRMSAQLQNITYVSTGLNSQVKRCYCTFHTVLCNIIACSNYLQVLFYFYERNKVYLWIKDCRKCCVIHSRNYESLYLLWHYHGNLVKLIIISDTNIPGSNKKVLRAWSVKLY